MNKLRVTLYSRSPYYAALGRVRSTWADLTIGTVGEGISGMELLGRGTKTVLSSSDHWGRRAACRFRILRGCHCKQDAHVYIRGNHSYGLHIRDARQGSSALHCPFPEHMYRLVPVELSTINPFQKSVLRRFQGDTVFSCMTLLPWGTLFSARHRTTRPVDGMVWRVYNWP